MVAIELTVEEALLTKLDDAVQHLNTSRSVFISDAILIKNGWRLFFYANERNEPPHIHARKGDMECKYWLLAQEFDIRQEYAYNLSPSSTRQIRRIVFENLEYLLGEYRRIHGSHI